MDYPINLAQPTTSNFPELSESIPIEIYEKIFSYLEGIDSRDCLLVCKKWQQIVSHNFTFKFPKVDDPFQTYDFFSTIVKIQFVVKGFSTLKLAGTKSNYYLFLEHLTLLSPHLKFLKLSEATIYWAPTVAYCKGLTKLDFDKSPLPENSFLFLQSLTDLKKLRALWIETSSPFPFTFFNQLQNLSFGLGLQSNYSLKEKDYYLTNLQKLNLSSIKNDFFDYKIIGKLSHLTALAIFPPIVHANAIHLTALTNLKKLYLYIEDFIPETFTRLTRLKKFTIQTSDSRPLTQLQYLTSLRCLRINTPERKCISLNLQALTGLNNLECYANQLETLDYFPSLTYLHLENINENLSSSFYSLLNKAHLNSLTSLTSLTLYLDECVPPYFDLLSRLIHLKSFYLNYWDGVVTLTGQLTQLNKLAIKAKNILLQNPLAINHLTFLVLNAREPVHSVDSQLNLLTRLTNLHYLSLDLKINLQEMQTILETLPNLRFLDYKGPYQTGTWLKNLKGNDFYYKLLNEQLI